MMNFISLEAIRRGAFDKALEQCGYVRSAKMAERWGITPSKLNKYFSAGYTCDCFKINGVRYISIEAPNPAEVKK